jgi:hypothetical protein
MAFSPHQNRRKVYMHKSIFMSIEQPVISQPIGVDFLPEKNPFSVRCHFLDQRHKIDRLKGRSELESGGQCHEIPQAKKNSSQNSRLLQKAALWLI